MTSRAASGSDIVVLAAPVRQNIELLHTIPERIAGDVLVTDVGSTKVAIERRGAGAAAARPLCRRPPLAGAASGGIESVRRDLFQGRPWLLTPLPTAIRPTRPEDLNSIESLVRSLGGVPYRLAPLEHDRLMAYVSHLPQLAVSALMQVVGDRVLHDGLLFAGNGLRDSTRLASSPPDTWRDIASTNAPTLEIALDDLIAALGRLRDDLEAEKSSTGFLRRRGVGRDFSDDPRCHGAKVPRCEGAEGHGAKVPKGQGAKVLTLAFWHFPRPRGPVAPWHRDSEM